MTTGKWTEEADNLLRKLMNKKAPKAEIMAAFPSKTYNALYLRMYRLNINPNHLGSAPVRKGKWENVQKFTAPETERKCMTCKAPFMSSGPGHRLCAIHRRESEDVMYAVRGR